ncbi:LysR family transcriptional regulator [Candidatus Pantoea deserta]|uniref:LysR family transcriptional regulator n=1 Tax=Candidatus Pantoea deserta TaxID=1869313 RepID=A0A3N4PFF5_9GAMM|nr:LysR family transcriptional regulator [Pantoea deserta]RPE03237.1 LysR family transcriptional regulator [Pantoea deserta]
MDLRNVEIFCGIADTGNLTETARRLNATAMTVSRRLAQLESELGVRLFQRTTRAVSLTSEGEEFLPYARMMLETEETARSLFSSETQGASGLLRVTAASEFGKRHLLPLLPALMEANPALKVDLNLTDSLVDIIGQGYDMALRLAPLKDSTLIAHKLADNPRLLCAAPGYLARHGQPACLSDLPLHRLLKISAVAQWMFEQNGQVVNCPVTAHFSCSSVEGVRAMCVAGVGIAQLTLLDVRDELRRGELVEITLSDVGRHPLAVWALLPTRQYIPWRTTVLLNALKRALQDVI